MNRVRTLTLTGMAAVGAVLLAACGGGSGSGYGSAPAGGPAPQTSNAAPAASGLKLAAATVGNLGTVVTNQDGRTLYRFDQDSGSPSKATCTGGCASIWPPVIATSTNFQLTGVDQSQVGTVTLADGSKQVTIGGWPVYQFSGDKAAGDSKGEGFMNLWYAVTPTGGKATAGSGGGSAPTSTQGGGGGGGGGGYGY